MKTRTGFVSNSSSTSFVVLFPHKPKTKEELKDMMFPKWAWHEVIEIDCEKIPTLTVQQIVERVFNDIRHIQKDRNNTLRDALRGHIYEIDEKNTITHIFYEGMLEAGTKDANIYHELVAKYGDEKWDAHKTDPKYKEWVRAKKAYMKAERKYYKERNSAVQEVYNNFRSRYKYHTYKRIFEYGDRYNEYTLEHGYVFRNLPHITVSNH